MDGWITVDAGLGFEPNDLANVFKKKFQSSCTVSRLPGKTENDSEIAIQGDVLSQLVVLFTETYGIDASLIDAQNKIHKSKKK